MSLLPTVTAYSRDEKGEYNYFFSLASESAKQWSKYPALSTVQLNNNPIAFTSSVTVSATSDDLLLNGIPLVNSTILGNTIRDWSLYPAISSINCGNNPILSTSAIQLDNVVLTATYDEILINGVPVVTSTALAQLSSITDWAYYEALSTVNMDGNDIINAKNIASQNIYNSLNIQTDTFSALTSIGAPKATITTIANTNLSTVNFKASNIQSLNISTNTVTCSNLNALNINGGSNFNVANWANYQAVNDIQMNGHNITTNSNLSITAPTGTIIDSGYGIGATAGQIDITSDRGGAVGLNTNLNITSKNGYRGIINIEAQQGYQGLNGILNLTASGGTIAGIGQGGKINITAVTPTGLSNLTSAVSISGGGVNCYAGVNTPIASLFGYNFIQGSLGVNIVAGLPSSVPNVPETVYIYAPLGLEIGTDTYLTNVYPYWNGIGGINDLVIQGRSVGLSNAYTVLSNCRDIYMDASATIHNPKNILGAGGTLNGFSTITGAVGTLETLNVSSINGITPFISSFGSASVSSLSVSTINGATPITQYISTFPNVYVTSNLYAPTVQTENITSGTTIAMSALNDISVVSQSGGQLFLASQYAFPGGNVIARQINASTINCYALNVSSINGIAQAGFIPF